MGAWFLFSCNCGYATRVSGMPDRGFIAESVTMECLDCKEIHNIVTNYFNEEDDDGNTGKCPECKEDNLVPWGQIDRYDESDKDCYGCPKCGDQMVRNEDYQVLYD